MKTAGIIVEFNPFHNGHKYLIDSVRKITGADNIIVISSGNYVQRGTPSMINKYTKAQMALQNGVDAFFELPVYFSTASAELFSRGAVDFLSELGVVDYLCFGCESDNLSDLSAIADVLSDESDDYKRFLGDNLRLGLSFPKARHNALNDYFLSYDISLQSDLETLINTPNNILAIEYLKALKFFNSSIKPIAIKRIGNAYDSLSVTGQFPSASGIREHINNNGISNLSSMMPDNCASILSNEALLELKDFEPYMIYKLCCESDFSKYYGVTLEMSNRINSYKQSYTTLDDFIKKIQSKNYTYSAISRALLHITLNITLDVINTLTSNGYNTRARLLGFKKDSELLSQIKANSSLPLVSKYSTYYHTLNNSLKDIENISLYADNLYYQTAVYKYGIQVPNEFKHQIIVNLCD